MTLSQLCDKPEESLRPAFLLRKGFTSKSVGPQGRACALTPLKEIGPGWSTGCWEGVGGAGSWIDTQDLWNAHVCTLQCLYLSSKGESAFSWRLRKCRIRRLQTRAGDTAIFHCNCFRVRPCVIPQPFILPLV